ncbi:hypothetical protein BH09BAC3_BH09BAC3_33370 [soil metagenome]
MKYFILFLSLLASQALFAQATEAPATAKPSVVKPPVVEMIDANSTLKQRFQIMKTKSQSYNDYKVIKETVLDGVWKITSDSINAGKVVLQDARTKIADLESKLKITQDTLRNNEASVKEMTYAGSHISVLGIAFQKGMFVTIVAVIVVALIGILLAIVGRLKSMHSAVKEKEDLVASTTLEFEEYKRKALERQTKLSRELQNERNKLTDIKRSN